MNGEDYIMSSFMICTPHQILCGGSNKEEWDGQCMLHIWETWEV